MGKQMEKERVPKIEAALRSGKLVVVVHGPPRELETVRRVMGEYGGYDMATYSANAA